MTDQQNRFLVAVGRIKVETNLSVTWVIYSDLENEIICLMIKYCINYESNEHNSKIMGGVWYDEFMPLIIQACDMPWKKIKKAWEKSFKESEK